MIVYLSLSMVALLSFFSLKQKRVGMMLFGLVLILIISLRNNVGYDFGQYIKIFSTYPIQDRHVQRLEWLNIIIIKVLRYFSIEHLGVFLYSIASYILIIKSFGGIEKFLGVLLVWIGLPFLFLASLSTIRQFLALGFAFFIFSRVDMRLIWRIFLTVLCMGLHQSGVVVLFILFLEYLNLSSRKILILSGTIALFLPFFISWASVIIGIEHLIDGRFGHIAGGNLQFWFILILSLPLLIESIQENSRGANSIFWIGLALFYVLLPYGLIASRVFLMFSFYFLMLLIKSRYYRMFYPRFLLAIVLFFSFYYGLYLGNLQLVNPYLPFSLIF